MIMIGLKPEMCDEADDGAVALEKFTKAIDEGTPYDLVFLDIIMPNMDGKSALRAMREVETRKNAARTPIFMVSASEQIEEVEELAEGLLRKPVQPGRLQEISSACAARHP